MRKRCACGVSLRALFYIYDIASRRAAVGDSAHTFGAGHVGRGFPTPPSSLIEGLAARQEAFGHSR